MIAPPSCHPREPRQQLHPWTSFGLPIPTSSRLRESRGSAVGTVEAPTCSSATATLSLPNNLSGWKPRPTAAASGTAITCPTKKPGDPRGDSEQGSREEVLPCLLWACLAFIAD